MKSNPSIVHRLKSVVCGLQSAVSPRAAFTLIELLVAMAILMVIVLMLANIFQQSTRAWGIGERQAEIGLEARAAINRIQQDLSQAIASSNYPFSSYNFYTLSLAATNGAAIEQVTYAGGSGSPLTRNGVQLLGADVDGFSIAPVGASPPSSELPDLVEIALTMKSSKKFSAARVYVDPASHGHIIDTDIDK